MSDPSAEADVSVGACILGDGRKDGVIRGSEIALFITAIKLIPLVRAILLARSSHRISVLAMETVAAIKTLIQQLAQSTDQFGRAEINDALRELQYSLETPFDTVMRMSLDVIFLLFIFSALLTLLNRRVKSPWPALARTWVCLNISASVHLLRALRN